VLKVVGSSPEGRVELVKEVNMPHILLSSWKSQGAETRGNGVPAPFARFALKMTLKVFQNG